MPRRLAVFADGTWNTPTDEDEGKLAPTNVAKMYEAVRRRPVATGDVHQLSYYHPGVGAKPNFLESGFDKLVGLLHIHTANRNILQGATGDGIDQNIEDCYRWLVQQYVPGDDIFLFGFSRGAYTVRSLAGFIRNSGLLRTDDPGLLADAFRLYRDRSTSTNPTSDVAVKFRQANSYEPRIHFIGVWDTVGALGIPLGVFSGLNAELYQFHDLTLSSTVDFAYHALAIDEQRKPFLPTLWEQQESAAKAGQVMRQMWFAGVHSNVGGGYAQCGLSDQTFSWIAQGAATAGLELDADYVKAHICNAAWNGDLRDSMNDLYRRVLGGAVVRPIAAGRTSAQLDAGTFDKTRERVHPSARERIGQVAPTFKDAYNPQNLADYIKRHPTEPSYP
jgi:uncharacterized protein (DUF2235 family)